MTEQNIQPCVHLNAWGVCVERILAISIHHQSGLVEWNMFAYTWKLDRLWFPVGGQWLWDGHQWVLDRVDRFSKMHPIIVITVSNKHLSISERLCIWSDSIAPMAPILTSRRVMHGQTLYHCPNGLWTSHYLRIPTFPNDGDPYCLEVEINFQLTDMNKNWLIGKVCQAYQ